MCVEVTKCIFDNEITSSWVIKKDVKESLQHVTVLSGQPKSLFHVRDDIPIQSMTICDLVGYLLKDNWKISVWQPLTTATRQLPPPIQTVTQRPKTFYVRQCTYSLSREYLRCLASISFVKEAEILHFQPTSYYKALLDAHRGKRLCLNGVAKQ